jgi:hypothetical protein
VLSPWEERFSSEENKLHPLHKSISKEQHTFASMATKPLKVKILIAGI